MNLGRHRAVQLHIAGNKNHIRTEPGRFDRRHSRTNTEFTRLIARSRHHAALPGTSHDQRTPPKLRMFPLFDRRIESVHIDMDDLAVFHFPALLFCFCQQFSWLYTDFSDGLRPARPVVTADSGFEVVFGYRVTASARHRSKTMRPNHKENNVCGNVRTILA